MNGIEILIINNDNLCNDKTMRLNVSPLIVLSLFTLMYLKTTITVLRSKHME